MTAQSAKPAAPAPKPVARTNRGNETELKIGGGVLAVLVLGGAAYAFARRKRQEEEKESYNEEPVDEAYTEPQAGEPDSEPEPVQNAVAEQQPPLITPSPSALAWGNETRRDEHVESENDDRRPGETWVERAYRGPSANNPSYSLRRRLTRAAFFDKQERQAAEAAAAASPKEAANVGSNESELLPA